MRVLLVLVLTFFVGCNASLVHADQPTSKLNVLIKTIDDIAGASARAVDRSLNYIMTETESGKFWSAQLRECFKQGAPYIISAWEQIPLEAQDLIVAVNDRTLSTIRNLRNEMNNAKRKIEPIFEEAALIAEEIAVKLIGEVELVKNIASPYVAWLELRLQEYLDTWKSTVNPQQ